MSYWLKNIEWRSLLAVESSPALWFTIREQRGSFPACPHCGSSQTAGCGWLGRGIILAERSRAPAAASGTERHHEDSEDNEQSLWCVLQGLVKPEDCNEAQTFAESHAERRTSLFCSLHDFYNSTAGFNLILDKQQDTINNTIL